MRIKTFTTEFMNVSFLCRCIKKYNISYVVYFKVITLLFTITVFVLFYVVFFSLYCGSMSLSMCDKAEHHMIYTAANF